MNNQEPQQHSLKDSVLEKIRTNATPMRSGSYFALKVIALSFVTILVLVLSVAICNFVFFSIGLNGPFVFLELFPWWLLILDGILIVLLEWLLRKFRFGYRSPILYLFLGILVLVISLSLLIDRETSFNDDLLHSADQHQLPPPFRNFIEDERQQPPPGSGVYKGAITAIDGDSFTMTIFGTSTPITVHLSPNDPFFGMLSVGEVVLVSANGPASTTISAQGVQLLPPLSMPPPDGDHDDDDHGGESYPHT